MVLHTAGGKDWAAVVFEYDTCTIKVGIVDPHELL